MARPPPRVPGPPGRVAKALSWIPLGVSWIAMPIALLSISNRRLSEVSTIIAGTGMLMALPIVLALAFLRHKPERNTAALGLLALFGSWLLGGLMSMD